MTAYRDNRNKSEAKTQRFNDVMANKRKLYLFKRVKKSVDGSNSNSPINVDFAQKSKLCTTTENDTFRLQSRKLLLNKTNSNSNSNSNSPSKCSMLDFQRNYSTAYDYENNEELCICKGLNRVSEPNESTLPLKVYPNCSCNENCHCSCRLSYHHHHNHNHDHDHQQQHHHKHHNIILKHKVAQKYLVGHNNDKNSNNEEIYMRNSYYLLRNVRKLKSPETDDKAIVTTASCDSTEKPSSTCSTFTRIEVERNVQVANTNRTHFLMFQDNCKKLPPDIYPRLYSTTNEFTKAPPSILPFYPTTFDDNELRIQRGGKHSPCHVYKVIFPLHAKQRLTYINKQQNCRFDSQKSLLNLNPSNISFAKVFLLSLSLFSICLPLSHATSSDFETTIQSSLAVLQRSAREAAASNELDTKLSPPNDKVRLAHPEYICKSLDIRNSVSHFRQLENCTVIEGFLLINLLHANSVDDFNETFPMLTEVTNYIIVYQVNYLQSIGRIFPNLSIIRGRTLFEGYALIIFANSHLEEIGLTKLTTISKGGIRIERNVMLCFVESIDWTQILSNTTDIVTMDNRNVVECPACPGDQWSVGDSNAGQNEFACKERHGRRHCWNSKSCQKFCPKRCRNNCVDENTCCNESCLGGCSPDNLNECISCRNFSIYNTTCVDKCPDNFYKFLDRRCVTAETCNIIGTMYDHNRQMDLVAINGICSGDCPAGYTKVNKTCVDCRNECTKKCGGGLIESGAKAREFHGCTHIVDIPLMINVKRGGDHLMEDLEHGLSAVTVIESSLKVHGTFGIFDLKFFKNLKRIEGRNLIDSKFAFYVLENADIEKIWNPNQTVQILRGSLYFHYNVKLCLSEINSLLPMINQTSFDAEDVSQDSNGRRGSCNTSLLVKVTFIGSFVAIVAIENPMVYEDERTFIGYQYLYTEDPYGNATKHAIRPCEDTWIVSAPTKNTVFMFSNLDPFTRYAFYVKTLTISTELRNAQSMILQFKTKSDQPNRINKLQAYSNSSYNIVMNWLPPSAANGKLIKYKIRALYDKRIQRIESRNYCKDPLYIPVATITEKPVVSKNCNCKKTTAHTYADDEFDANLLASIELENALQNFVYVKKANEQKKRSAKEILDQKDNRSRRAIEGDPFDSFLLRHIRDTPNNQNLIYDTTTTTSTTTSATMANDLHNNGTPHYNESRMDAKEEYYEVVVDSVNASTTEYVFSKLKHFSFYMLGVEACREKDSENDTSPLCSIEVNTYVRTLKLENVDRVEELRAVRETTNSSRSNIRLFWEQPSRPNGAVVSYTILYLLQAPDAVEEKKCITDADYLELGYQQNGYVLTNLNPGNYSIRINTNTLAGEGQYSKTIYVNIPPVIMSLSVIIGIIVGALCAAILIGVFTYYLCRKRILAPPSDLKIFPSVNPHYISLQYIPDEWEVARDKIIQLNPLGQGSFGMVYEGILKGYNNSNEDTPCAIKTVNENATDRERMNFLNEACVMKQFDTFHVVRLLGVCSRGQPALMIMELMKNGDLKSYLRAHRPDETDEMGMPISTRSEISAQRPNISRIYQMAIEIADGMAYLAAKKFVHRDLAARNCMVAADLTVKIGDFGMTRDIYENDYYRKGTKGLLPVRWMPPESLRDGIYSTASDVFSYGVVLWEMATLASQPYQGLSNDQVLRYVIDGGVMERPENCPDKLYSLMQKCWHHRPSARPTFMEIIRYLLDLAEPHFCEVSFYHSDEGQQIILKEKAERNQSSGDVFDDHDNDMEDVTTPLRLEEYGGYKLNMDNNSSVEHRGDSSMIIDDDAPHSPYSLTSSPMVVSSTPDEHIRNNFTMSRIINSHNQILNSAPSTSAELRKSGSGISYYPQPHTHPHHRNLYQPTRYSQQQQKGRAYRTGPADAYVHPDFELKDLIESKRSSDEQGYEMYDPSPNYSEKANVHDEYEDDVNACSATGQSLLISSKGRQKQPSILPLSSSVPDEVIGQSAQSSLHPSTASAASSNASFKAGKYPTLRAVADSLGNNVTSKFRSILFNTHKRSGSNASYKSTSSNPNTGGVGSTGGSSNNLTRGGRGKSMSGQNLGTIESGGSGSAGSYCANTRLTNPINPTSSTSENPNYKRLDDESIDTNPHKSKVPSSSAFSMSSNPNYQVLDESLNTSALASTNHPATSSSLLHTTDDSSYQLMQAPATQQKPENTSSYVMMNEPKCETNSAISISNNPNYQIMGPPPSAALTERTMPSSVLPQLRPSVAARRTGGGAALGTKYSSSSSAVSNSSSHESDEEEDDDLTIAKGAKADRIPLNRRSSGDRAQKKKHVNNRSRSQSSSSSSRSSNTATTTTQKKQQRHQHHDQQQQQQQEHEQQQQQQQQPSTIPTSLIASSTLLTKEKWLNQQPNQSLQSHSQPSPPPNGFVGREAS